PRPRARRDSRPDSTPPLSPYATLFRSRIAAVIAVSDELGSTGLGEAAPLPGTSIDTIEDAQHAVTELAARMPFAVESPAHATGIDRKSTRLNSSHVKISYAVFCLKKKR